MSRAARGGETAALRAGARSSVGSTLARALGVAKSRNYSLFASLIASRLGFPLRARRSTDCGVVVAEPWTVDRVDIGGGRLRVQGWSIPSGAAAIERREFRFNGRPLERIEYPLPRPDVGKVFWQRANGELCGFDCTTPVDGDVYRDGALEIERVRPSATPLDRGRDCWFVPDPARHADLPDEDRRFRVIGNRDRDGFLATGATDYHRLDRAVTALSGRRLHEFARVLDWGSGCGRVARHFPRSHASALTGCDIDHDNVAWCRAHLPGTFVASAIDPPLPFDNASFDLLYGISVFTHLREPLQLAWLDELARVTARGAYLLLTVHGPTALEFASLREPELAATQASIARSGLLVASSNAQIDGHADHRGEYVNVFHSHDYIRRTWSRHFDVVHILPGYIFTHDVVVLRKR